MNYREKRAYVEQKLAPYRLSRNGAIALAGIEGIIEFLEQEELPPNSRSRPAFPLKGRNGTSLGSASLHAYRTEMMEYLSQWITLTPILSNGIYEALADYCEARVTYR